MSLWMSLCGAPNKAYVSSDRHQSLPLLQGETQGNTIPNVGHKLTKDPTEFNSYTYSERTHNEDTEHKTKDQISYT